MPAAGLPLAALLEVIEEQPAPQVSKAYNDGLNARATKAFYSDEHAAEDLDEDFGEGAHENSSDDDGTYSRQNREQVWLKSPLAG